MVLNSIAIIIIITAFSYLNGDVLRKGYTKLASLKLSQLCLLLFYMMAAQQCMNDDGLKQDEWRLPEEGIHKTGEFKTKPNFAYHYFTCSEFSIKLIPWRLW